VHLKL